MRILFKAEGHFPLLLHGRGLKKERQTETILEQSSQPGAILPPRGHVQGLDTSLVVTTGQRVLQAHRGWTPGMLLHDLVHWTAPHREQSMSTVPKGRSLLWGPEVWVGSRLCLSLDLERWAIHLTSLCLSLLICKVGIMIGSSSPSSFEDFFLWK